MPVRTHRAWLAAVGLLAVGSVSGGAQQAPNYEVYAVRYAMLPGFPLRAMVAGADSTRTIDGAMSVWLARGGGKTVLIDAGFYRPKFVDRWKPSNFVSPAEALSRAGVRPEQVTDIVVTHVHWDHVDGVDLFPNAQVWIQKTEYDHHISPNGTPRESAIDADDARMLSQLKARGRVREVNGDSVQIIPGITVYTGGKHTFGSQYAGIKTESGTVVIASDNLYLYENLDRRRPIAQTLDSLSNLRSHERMRRLASDPRLIVPGHDPAVFTRFPSGVEGIARIK